MVTTKMASKQWRKKNPPQLLSLDVDPATGESLVVTIKCCRHGSPYFQPCVFCVRDGDDPRVPIEHIAELGYN